MKPAPRLPIIGITLLTIGLVLIQLKPPPQDAQPLDRSHATSHRAPVIPAPHQDKLVDQSAPTAGHHDEAIAADEYPSTVDRTIRTLLANHFQPPATAVFSPDLDTAIKQVRSESWLDPEDKAVRRRVRVVDSEFKYPQLRIEEDVAWNSVNSRFESTLRRASVADHLMVMPAAGQDPKVVVDELVSHGFTVRSEMNGLLLLEIPNSTEATAQLEAIEKLEALNRFVDFAEPDYLVFPCIAPNDPLYADGQQWSLENKVDSAVSIADADIDAEGGWGVRNSAASIIVAVLDTGVRYTHEDLVNRIWQDGLGNPGWDAYDNDDDPMDTNGHGTHCAGIVGAQGNNGLGIAGVAWNVKIMPIRFIGELGGTTSDAIRSINYARENGADIISASWGGSGYSRGLLAAIEACYAVDIPVVTAAGNERWNVDAKPQYPASYTTPNIVTVAATTRKDELTTFSNYGYTAVDLAAPGENILSCGIASDSDYKFLSGTSAATPHVAGALALAKAQFGAEPVDELIMRLLRSVDRVSALDGKVAMEGRLNLRQLLLSSSTGFPYDFFNSPYIFKYTKGSYGHLTTGLTREPDEDSYCPDTGNRSAWFQWTAIGDGLMSFTGEVDVPNSPAIGEDVSVVAFEGTIRNELRRIKDNFVERPTTISELRFYVKKGKTYTFSVDTRSSIWQAAFGSFKFTPGNDMFSQAVLIPTGTTFNVEGTNASATIEPFETSLPHQNLVQQASVWWKWTPSTTGDYVISTLGSNFDTVLGVYKRSAGGGFETVGVNDSRSLTDDTSRLELALTGGQQYYIVVASYHKDTVGDIKLSGFPKKEIRFLQQPASQLVRQGDPIQLSVITDTTSEATYEWYGPQGQLGGVGSQSRITIPAAGPNDMGDYYVLVKDGEASGQSANATITELALPPRFLFSPQDVSVMSGTSIPLQAKADGLQPVTLRWFKNGVQVQTGHFHTIANATPSDSGIYHVEASNVIGTTKSHPFQILVSNNTFGPLTYRSPGIPSASKIKFVNGLHMGFGNDGRLILSPNGINWENPTIPLWMSIKDIDYDAVLGLYVLVGENRDNAVAASAVSLDGRNWTKNPAPLPDWSSMEKVVAGNGIFVGYFPFYANKLYTTTNGIDWIQRDYTITGSETWKHLQNIVYYNGEFIGGGRGTIFRSSDGINWTSNATPNDGRILIWNGKLATFTGSPVGLSTSTDGINWTTPVPCVGIPSDLTRITSNGTRFYHAISSMVASSPDGINWHQMEYEIKPTNPYSSSANFVAVSGPEGNLVALGGGGILQGASYTQLVSPNPADVFALPPITKIFGNTIYQLDDTTSSNVVYSNDLRTWKTNNISSRFQFEGDSLIQAKGKFWALGRPYLAGQQTLLSGSSPLDLSAHPQGTFNTSIKYLRAWNNDVYATSDSQVLKLDANSNWQVVYNLPVNGLEKIRALKTINRGIMIWTDYGAVYTSLNGSTWTRQWGITADIDHPATKPYNTGPSFCEFNGKAYIYIPGTNTLHVAATGFSFSTQQNLNPFSRLTAVPEGLLGIEGSTAWFSPDGTTWQQFPIHYLTYSFHHYNGTLLAYSQNGLYQAGTPASRAPVNSITDLVDYQTVVSGCLFDLNYSALDPEDRFDHVEFYLNGALVGQSTSASGLTSINITGGGERVLEMRSFDQDGQVTSDFWSLYALSSAPDMLLYAPSSPASASYSVWNNRLQVGIGQELFSKVDDDWIGRTMPFTLSSAQFLFNPDAVFAVGPNIGSNQNVLKSEDGIRWNGLNYYVNSMQYQDGRHLAKLIRHRNEGQTSNLGVSPDGITWNKSSAGNLSSAAGNGMIVGASGAGFGLSTIKASNDGGATWTSRASLEIYSVQFDSGYFHGIGKTTYYRSTDGITWTNLTPALVSGEEIKFLDIAGGWYYLMTGGFNVSYMWISQDKGTTWTKLTTSPFPFTRVYYASGIWFAKQTGGIYASTDGLNWSLSIPFGGTQQADVPYATSGLSSNFCGHEGGATVATNNGLWTTQDGFHWTKETLPQTAATPPVLAEPMTIDASTKAINLQAKAFLSNDGTNWHQSPFVPGSGLSVRHVQLLNNKLLIYCGAINAAHQLWESSDGINFSQVTLNGNYYFTSMKRDSSRLFAKGNIIGGASNQFFVSSDGANWTQLTTPAYFTSTIELENNTLVILDSFNQKIHHSTDGVTWETTNLRVENLVYGNGVFLASMNSTMYRGATIASLATVTSNASPYQAKITFANGIFYLKTTSGIWKSTNGESWQQIYSSLTGNLDSIGNTIYLNDGSSLRPLIAPDLQVTTITGTPSNLAVGANINATLNLRNVGNAPVPAGTNITVRGMLTRDRLFGNEDDVLAGTDQVTLASELAVDASTGVAVSFRVPGLRAGGQFKLVLTIDPESPELSSTNNSAMTDANIVTVDEFVLNIVRNGDGNVGRDVAGVRYANGTLVTLNANAAKGSGFGGWSGSSVSPLSQITVMMNQDQNLTASFLTTATLQLSIVGNGSVTGWADPGSYLIGSTASLTAVPESGWEFARWAGGSTSTNASLSLTVNQNTNLTAIFRQTANGWKSAHFTTEEQANPAVSGDLIDADGDGIPNWREYLHGSNPKDARSKGLLQQGIDGGFLQIIYTRNAGIEAPYAIICEGTRDMVDWEPVDFEQRILSTTNGIETVEARMPADPATNPKGFMRIRYVKP